MNKHPEMAPWLIAPVLIITFVYFVWPTPYSQYKSGATNLRVNRFTGKTQYLSDSGWCTDIDDSQRKPYQFTDSEMADLMNPVYGRASLDIGSSSRITIRLHNSATRNLFAMKIHVSITDPTPYHIERDYEVKASGPIGSNEDGELTTESNLPDGPNQTNDWQIVSARSY